MKQAIVVLAVLAMAGTVMAANIEIDTDDVAQPDLTLTRVSSVKITTSMIDVTLYEGYMDEGKFVSVNRSSIYYRGDEYDAFMTASEINIPATRTFISNNMEQVEQGK